MAHLYISDSINGYKKEFFLTVSLYGSYMLWWSAIGDYDKLPLLGRIARVQNLYLKNNI